MSAFRVGTRVLQTMKSGAVRFGKVVEIEESEFTGRCWIAIRFDEFPGDASWFEPRDLERLRIIPVEALPFRFPASAEEMAKVGLCQHCMAIPEGVRP